MQIPPPHAQATPDSPAAIDQSLLVALNVKEALHGLKNGHITISVHDGQIVQIERILRKRQFKQKPLP